MIRLFFQWVGLAVVIFSALELFAADVPPPDYSAKIAPIFQKYCTGCHNADDQEGGLSLESFAQLQKGGERGGAILPGDGQSSRLVRVLTGQAEPAMPPEDNEAPTADEIALLIAWIDAGAKGPDGAEPDRKLLIVPEIDPPQGVGKAIASVAYSPDGKLIAVGRFGEVELLSAEKLEPVRKLGDQPGKVNAVSFSSDGTQLLTASGVSGLYGKAVFWNTSDGSVAGAFEGHRDTIYDAVLSPDGKLIATASYDRKIILWEIATGRQIRTLEGHNDAIYDLAFSPDGTVLASASGDQTVKLWHVSTGERLDTLSQPLAEQYAVAFSPDGQYVLAGGVDNRIRVWRLVSREKPAINPILFVRYAHEGAIVRLAFSPDGRTLVSAAEDRTIKLWETKNFTQVQMLERQPDVAPAVAFSPSGANLAVGRLDGSLQVYPVSERADPVEASSPARGQVPAVAADAKGPMSTLAEQEPNDMVDQATPIMLPATVSGVIQAGQGKSGDVDLFRFESKAGQSWMIEIDAARSKSPLDSKIEVLDAKGEPVLRLVLRAVLDSYVDFRGVDSAGLQFRLHNWEDMEMNDYLYVNGEVCRLYQPPRGPDSGFEMYPNRASRYGYFDTTPVAHPLHQPCYIVQPQPPGAELPPTGLPVFPLYYENDDDGRRKLGSDSQLTFTTPADGNYLVRVSDVRGFEGEKFKYKLVVRSPRPDFNVKLEGDNPTVNAGSGKKFSVLVDRIDGFDDEVRVDVTGLPPGFTATTPLVVQAGHETAQGTIHAAPGVPVPTPEQSKMNKVTATAVIAGRDVTKEVNHFGEIKLERMPKILVTLSPPDYVPPESPRRKWTVIKPVGSVSRGGATLVVQEDGSILAGGANPQSDTYTVVVNTEVEGITAFRIESLDPGRADGKFVLSEFRVEAAPLGQADKSASVKVLGATADSSAPGWHISGARDDKPETGWSAQQSGDSAVFVTAGPVGFKGGTTLVFSLVHRSKLLGHNLGRFRLAISTDPPAEIPPPGELVIAPGQTITAVLRVERHGFEGRVQFIPQNLPHGVIVDNLGLNGVLIPEGQAERTIFLSAARWVPETTRPVYFEAQEEDKQSTRPVVLHVRRSGAVAGASPN